MILFQRNQPYSRTRFSVRARSRENISIFTKMALAPRLLYRRVSGGFSGPASRSGVPLEHPPYQQLPAWLQGESKDTPCPAMYSRWLSAISFQPSASAADRSELIAES